MTQRTEQVASSLHRAVQTVLSRGLNDPRVRGLVSVVSVRVSDDLANATIGISVIPEEHEKLTLHGVKHAAQHIRTEASNLLKIRRMPVLSFRIDHSVKKQAEIQAAINRASRPEEETPLTPPEEE